MEELIKKVEEWSKERNLDTADPNKQRLKLWEEFGELMQRLLEISVDLFKTVLEIC